MALAEDYETLWRMQRRAEEHDEPPKLVIPHPTNAQAPGSYAAKWGRSARKSLPVPPRDVGRDRFYAVQQNDIFTVQQNDSSPRRFAGVFDSVQQAHTIPAAAPRETPAKVGPGSYTPRGPFELCRPQHMLASRTPQLTLFADETVTPAFFRSHARVLGPGSYDQVRWQCSSSNAVPLPVKTRATSRSVYIDPLLQQERLNGAVMDCTGNRSAFVSTARGSGRTPTWRPLGIDLDPRLSTLTDDEMSVARAPSARGHTISRSPRGAHLTPALGLT